MELRQIVGRRHPSIQPLVNNRSTPARQVAARVHRSVVQPYFVVEMRSGCAARHSHPTDHLILRHALSDSNGVTPEVAVPRRHTIAMIDDNEIAVISLTLGNLD